MDEALAVGDAKFQARCMKRIRQLKEQGVTILFVSHDSSSVKMLCKRATLMSHGRILETGEPKKVVNHYIALLSSDKSEIDSEEIASIESREDFVKSQLEDSTHQVEGSIHRHGNKLASINSVKLKSLGGKEIATVETGTTFQVIVSLMADAELSDLVVGISIRNLMGLVMYGTNTQLMGIHLPELKEAQRLIVNFQLPCYLNRGIYTITAGIHSEEGLSYDWIDELVIFEVSNSVKCEGIVDMRSSVSVGEERCYVSVQEF